MTSEHLKRKLVAVLIADVKGYSRLMSMDEEATVRMLSSYKDAMDVLIRQHGGRVVDAPGDNLLAEFASVVDAVQCAVEIQKELRGRNAGLPEERRMEFRIGVNLGDVVEEGEKRKDLRGRREYRGPGGRAGGAGRGVSLGDSV